MRVCHGLLLLLLLAGPAAAETTGTAESTADQQAAFELLSAMVEFAADLTEYSVRIDGGFDVLQPDGQMIQFLEQRRVAVRRPDAMRAEEAFSGRAGNLVVFDGATVTVYDPNTRAYAQTETPGSLDDAVIYFQRELGMRLPLGGLFTTRLLRDMLYRIRRIDYVETAEVNGLLTHHLAARTDTVDFQVWLSAEGPPLPRRMVLTYPDEGRPQFWAEFSDWDLDAELSAETFRFEPPADAFRVPFVVQMADTGGDGDD